jgi:signal transduction histidine kinase
MTSGSLRTRLVLAGAAAIIAALFAAGVGLTYLFERHVLRSLGDDLDVHVRQILAAIDLDPAGKPFLTRPPSDPRFNEPLSGLYWQISLDRGYVVRSRSLCDATLPLEIDKLDQGETHRHQIAGPSNSKLLAVESRVRLTGSEGPMPVRIAVAADLAGVARARRAFAADLIPALTLLGLVLAAATWIQIGLGLKPLKGLRDGIAAIRNGKSQLIEGTAPTEVAPLVEEINGLLTSQARDMERSRSRAADLAHGLKTPLSALAADVRTLDAKGEHEIAARIRDVGEAMRRHVERELARARIRGARGHGGGGKTPLVALVTSLISIQQRTGEGRKLSFETQLAGDPAIAMDKADLAEVLGNLIENAARHARSRVRVDRRRRARHRRSAARRCTGTRQAAR